MNFNIHIYQELKAGREREQKTAIREEAGKLTRKRWHECSQARGFSVAGTKISLLKIRSRSRHYLR